MQWIFETLGIEADADAGAIRKAYARAIKQCDQATEAGRFQRIRQAYELAMQRAAQRSLAARAPKQDTHETAMLAAESTRQDTGPASVPNQEWQALWDEFLQACSGSDANTIAHILGAYADDVRLTSLDAKSDFERAVLALAFAAPVNIALLDAACDLFAWEYSNKHLADVRPDLVYRLHRHQALLYLLRHNRHQDIEYLDRARKAYDTRSLGRPPSWQVGQVNKALDRCAAYKRELDERYGQGMFDWWRQLLADEQGHAKPSQPTASQSPGMSNPHVPSPKSFRTEQARFRPRAQQTRTPTGAMIFLIGFMTVMSLVNQYSKTEPGSVVPINTQVNDNPSAAADKVRCRSRSNTPYAGRLLNVPTATFTYPDNQPSSQFASAGRLQTPYAPGYQGGVLVRRAGLAADASGNCAATSAQGATAPRTER